MNKAVDNPKVRMLMIYPIEIDIRYNNSDVDESFTAEKLDNGILRVKRVLNNGLQQLECYVQEDGESDDMHSAEDAFKSHMINIYDVVYRDIVSEEPRRFPKATVIISKNA